MDDEPTTAPDEEPDGPSESEQAEGSSEASSAVDVDDVDMEGEGDAKAAAQDPSPHDEIVDLPWDDDLPVALGEETEATEAPDDGEDSGGDEDASDRSDWEHEYEFDEGEHADKYFARKRVERQSNSWRSRTATGAIATAIAMGLQQVFEPEKRRPAAVAEAPSDPYSDDDPITVEYVPDDAEATTVRVKPWLLQKGDPT